MEFAERINRYKAIEQRRGRPLIVYATSTRQGVPAMMAADAVREFIDQIDAVPAETKGIDILIHSSGGDGLTAWKLMSVLRERFENVAVLVPYMAFSAATMFALGADEIVMHPHASLGPIDPQITILLPDGKRRGFSFEDVGAFIRLLSNEFGVTEQAYVSTAIDKLFSVVDPVHLGAAKRASELATDVGERLLQMHMTTPQEQMQTRPIAEGLNKSFFAHGDALSRSRARELKLKIAKDDREIERLIWDAYLGIESYLQLRNPFQPLEHFVANGGAAAIAPVAAVALPQNAPAQLANQVWGQVAQNALQALGQPALSVDYSFVNAVVESPRRASEFRTEGSLTGARVPGGEVRLVTTDRETGWRQVPVPAPAPAETPEAQAGPGLADG